MAKRVEVDDGQVAVFAKFLRDTGDAAAFDFCSLSEGFIYPDRNRPGVLDYFFFACAHQFGFWTLDGEGRWEAPMIAPLDRKPLKGSDFLWRACTRAWQRDSGVFAPEYLAGLSDAEWSALFHDDHGNNPLPMWDEHLALAKQYASWCVEKGQSPEGMVRAAQESERPLAALLELLVEVPGYAKDPLQKKAMLLAITLENRPEHFLRVTDPESARPIIDYHLQRSALRTGLVRVTDEKLRDKLVARAVLSADEEDAVRQATYRAIESLMQESGKSAAAVDWFFFQNRRRCPEVEAPDCAVCPVDAICAHEVELFQPVFRTTAY